MQQLRFKSAFKALRTGGFPRWLNILGLSFGYSGIMLVMLLYHHETSYDSWLEDAGSIYRLESSLNNINGQGRVSHSSTSPPALGPKLKQTLPYIDSMVRLFRPKAVVIQTQSGENVRSALNFADVNFFDFFALPLLHGTPETALSRPDQVVLTKREAERLFGDLNPIGQQILGNGSVPLTVSGVLDTLPLRTHFRFFGMITPVSSPLSAGQNEMDNAWTYGSVLTYVKINNGGSEEILEKDVVNIYSDNFPGYNNPESENYRTVDALNIQDIRLNTKSDGIYMKPRGDVELINTLWISAIGILFISIMNFINIENSILLNRYKELTIKKIYGSSLYSLFIDLFMIFLLISIIPFIFAISFTIFITSFYENMLNINIDIFALLDFKFITISLALFFIIIILSSIYPAWMAAHIRPASALRSGHLPAINLANGFFLILQFAITSFLIVSSIIVSRQMAHLGSFDRGIDIGNTYQITIDTGTEGGLDALVAEAALQPEFEGIARIGAQLPYEMPTNVVVGHLRDGRQAKAGRISSNLLSAGPGLPDIFDFKPLAGRWFSASRRSDGLEFRRTGRSGAAVISLTLSRALGYNDPSAALGQSLNMFDGMRAKIEVIGVVPDIKWGSGRQKRSPMIYIHSPKKEDSFVYKTSVVKSDDAENLINSK